MRSLSNFGIETSLIDLVLNIDVFFDNTEIGLVLINHALEDFVKEISGVDIISLISIRQLKGVDIEYGATYLILLTCLIPSLLYSGKPETTLGTWFGDKYWFTQEELLKFGEGAQANIFHIIGEVHINFGFFALIFIPLIFYLYGSLLGALMKKILRKNLLYLPVYVFLVRIMHEIILTLSTIATVFSSIVKQFILVSVFMFVFLALIYCLKISTKLIFNK
jgi:hypothetical protein